MLRLPTKGRYATRIMVYLARGQESPPVTKQEIADAEEISPDYVEQILTKLKAAGLVRSHRGAKGGFSLARDARAITVADVLQAAEGPFSFAPCLSGSCRRAARCVTRPLWRRADEALRKIFSETTIGEMAEEARKMLLEGALTFEI